MADPTSPTSAYAFECVRCDTTTTVRHEGYDAICTTCNDVCVRIRMCDECGTRPAAHTEEFCIECLADFSVREPGFFPKLLMSTRAEVGEVLARRQRGTVACGKAVAA